jgi:hypothetical protein
MAAPPELHQTVTVLPAALTSAGVAGRAAVAALRLSNHGAPRTGLFPISHCHRIVGS